LSPKEEQNEEITFGVDPFGVGNCHPAFCDGRGKYKYWISSSATCRFRGASGGDSGA